MQSVIAGNADVTRPSGHASHGHDKPNPKEGSDHEEGMYVGQAATKVETSYPITEGHAKGLHVLATQEQDSKEFKGERGEEWLPLVTIVNQESANSDHPKVHSPTTEEQDLLSPPPRELMVKQVVCVNQSLRACTVPYKASPSYCILFHLSLTVCSAELRDYPNQSCSYQPAMTKKGHK